LLDKHKKREGGRKGKRINEKRHTQRVKVVASAIFGAKTAHTHWFVLAINLHSGYARTHTQKQTHTDTKSKGIWGKVRKMSAMSSWLLDYV